MFDRRVSANARLRLSQESPCTPTTLVRVMLSSPILRTGSSHQTLVPKQIERTSATRIRMMGYYCTDNASSPEEMLSVLRSRHRDQAEDEDSS